MSISNKIFQELCNPVKKQNTTQCFTSKQEKGRMTREEEAVDVGEEEEEENWEKGGGLMSESAAKRSLTDRLKGEGIYHPNKCTGRSIALNL